MLQPKNRLAGLYGVGWTKHDEIDAARDWFEFSELMLASVNQEPYSFNKMRFSRLKMQRGLQKLNDDAARVLGWHDAPRVD